MKKMAVLFILAGLFIAGLCYYFYYRDDFDNSMSKIDAKIASLFEKKLHETDLNAKTKFSDDIKQLIACKMVKKFRHASGLFGHYDVPVAWIFDAQQVRNQLPDNGVSGIRFYIGQNGYEPNSNFEVLHLIAVPVRTSGTPRENYSSMLEFAQLCPTHCRVSEFRAKGQFTASLPDAWYIAKSDLDGVLATNARYLKIYCYLEGSVADIKIAGANDIESNLQTDHPINCNAQTCTTHPCPDGNICELQ